MTDVLGYACMNRTLRERDQPVRCNRDMRRSTWESEGLAYASELTRQNVADLLAILRLNRDHDIRFYRCTSTLVPWNSQFDLPDLPDYNALERTARKCGALVEDAGMRLTFHPDQWCKLASDSPDTVDELASSVSDRVGVPVVFDYHHHGLADRGRTYREGFETAATTCDRPPTTRGRNDSATARPARRPTRSSSPTSRSGSGTART